MKNPCSGFMVAALAWKELLPHKDAIRAIRDAGFRGVEVLCQHGHFDWENPDEVEGMQQALSQWQDAVVTVHGPFRECDLSCPDPEERERSVAMALNAVKAAKSLNARSVTFHPRISKCARQWNDDNRVAFTKSFTRLSQEGAALGVTIVLENMLPGRFTSQEDELGSLVDSFSPENVGICIDTGHANLNGNLIGFAQRFASRARTLHLQDNTGENGDEHLIPGRGTVAWNDFAKALNAGGFQGEKIFEVRSIGTMEETLEAIKQSITDTALHQIRNGY